jgi:hypothetical protein
VSGALPVIVHYWPRPTINGAGRSFRMSKHDLQARPIYNTDQTARLSRTALAAIRSMLLSN